MFRRLALIVGFAASAGMSQDISARADRHRIPLSSPAKLPVLAIAVTPTIGGGSTADGVDVAYTFDDRRFAKSAASAVKAPLTLRWDTLGPPPGRSSDVVQKLVVRDTRGPLTMTASAAPVDGYTLYTSDRAPVGPVAVRYHVPVADPSAPGGRGPHREMIAAGNGITTSGDGFMLLPELRSKVDLRLHWQLPSGFGGVSSFGLGDVRTIRDGDEVLNGFYLAGPLRQFPRTPPKYGFSAYGLGENDVDMTALLAWSAKQFEITRAVFSGDPETTFRAFYRSYDGGAIDSGRADPNGILLYIAPTHRERDTLQQLKELMAHEVIHVFQPRLSDGNQHLWFNEGSADYLAARLAFDAGMIDTKAYVAFIEDFATPYYGNTRRNIANSAIAGEMWKSADSWMVPYSRGAIYFADLDARVRTRSGGKVTLITLMKDLRDRKRAGKPYGAREWRDLVMHYAGPEGQQAHDAMLAGKTIIPVAGAFGPCVIAVPDRVGVLDMLYRTAPQSNLITEVAAGSNAEKAGLRAGDRLAANTLVLPSVRDRNRPIELAIKRDGKPMTISYVPRTNETVEARRWTSAPAAGCRKAPL